MAVLGLLALDPADPLDRRGLMVRQGQVQGASEPLGRRVDPTAVRWSDIRPSEQPTAPATVTAQPATAQPATAHSATAHPAPAPPQAFPGALLDHPGYR
ncbi:hypothetical protein ACIBBD_02585 [Streptomyces sp. NPDC051315]|uniref:hypothetical protein n=1 Tax=Streptomyces sp. NPDC051315 TaxID=3365650 RepID=UPI0037B9B7FD